MLRREMVSLIVGLRAVERDENVGLAVNLAGRLRRRRGPCVGSVRVAGKHIEESERHGVRVRARPGHRHAGKRVGARLQAASTGDDESRYARRGQLRFACVFIWSLMSS